MNPAILLLAYGGPNSLNDIPEYLLDIRGGRHTPRRLIDEISERYALIGGRSPLLEITNCVAEKLADKTGLPVYVGMRHWPPRIEEVVRQMLLEDDIDQIIAIPQAPHYSRLSVGKYREALELAVAMTQVEVEIEFVESWHTEEHYLAGISENVRATLAEFAPVPADEVMVIFTAHSLPEFILEQGDPYDAQLRETAALLAGRLGLAEGRWMFCYQSAAQTGVPWLGPQVEEVVVELGKRGERYLLVAPIGFIANHVEVLYDIDIGVRQIAEKHGITLKRPPMLNDSPALVNALAALAVRSRVLEI
ncbi:MAG: ferrochelatase [Caldilineales bacterium]|nr:ferrochelatase [Caldilineales bacterium]